MFSNAMNKFFYRIICEQSNKYIKLFRNQRNEISHKQVAFALSCKLLRPYVCHPVQSFISQRCINSDTEATEDVFLETENNDYEQLKKLEEQYFFIPGNGHRSVIVQPVIKSQQKTKATSDLLLRETTALIETLDNWTVQKTVILSTKEPHKKLVFSSGNFDVLKEEILSARSSFGVTAIVFSVDKLTGLQHASLEKELGLPVYDRYTIVLHIFKEHAKSKDAKLQVALAEIPLLRSRLKGTSLGHQDKHGGKQLFRKGSGETFLEMRRRILMERELKLRKALDALKSRRATLRNVRKKKEFPIISVVGYTNAGKTCLIKALTKEEEMQPKDQLFATLDVTAHAGFLPNRMTVIFMDTVGFITDIPTNLIEAFKATLEDVQLSDLIIHVKDANHPDYDFQGTTVRTTLKNLDIPQHLLDNMIEVDNKADLLSSDKLSGLEAAGNMPISSVTNFGLMSLLLKIQEKILSSSNRKNVILRIPTGGDESRWLYKSAAIVSVAADDDPQFSLFEVVISESYFKKFKRLFNYNEIE